MKELDSKISKGLFRIRIKRYVCLTIIFGFLPVCSWLASLGITFLFWGTLFLFMFGLIMQRRLHHSQCPRCGKNFFVQQFKRNNYHPIGSLTFPVQKKCQSCGLNLYKGC